MGNTAPSSAWLSDHPTKGFPMSLKGVLVTLAISIAGAAVYDKKIKSRL